MSHHICGTCNYIIMIIWHGTRERAQDIFEKLLALFVGFIRFIGGADFEI